MRKLTVLYFSPSGTTKEALESVVKGTGIDSVEYVNLTDFHTRWSWRNYGKDDLVLLGIPTYGGRLAPAAKEIFNRTTADGTPLIGLVTYGNRAYEDALIEMQQKATTCGFRVFAAAAAIGQHTLNAHVATGRPDAEDRAQLFAFGQQAIEKLKCSDLSTIEVPGNIPLKVRTEASISPTADENCTSCGACVKSCPVMAINPHRPSQTDNYRCILCGSCVSVCDQNARAIRHPQVNTTIAALQMIAAVRKEPEFYL